MRDADLQPGLGLEPRMFEVAFAGFSPAPADAVTVDMGVTEPGEMDPGALDRQGRLGVVEEVPALASGCGAGIGRRLFEPADEGLDVEVGVHPVFDLGR